MLLEIKDFEGWLCISEGQPVTKVTKDFPWIKEDTCSLCVPGKADYAVVDALTGDFQHFMYCTECLHNNVYYQDMSGDKWFAPATIPTIAEDSK